MEVYANKKGQTIIHLSKTEWKDYGREAGYEEQAVTVPQELSGIIGDILVAYQEDHPEWESDEVYKKMEAKAGEAQDILLKLTESDNEDPNADITEDSRSAVKTAQTFLEPHEAPCEWCDTCNDGRELNIKEKCPKCERIGEYTWIRDYPPSSDGVYEAKVGLFESDIKVLLFQGGVWKTLEGRGLDQETHYQKVTEWRPYDNSQKTASTDDEGLIGPFKLRACDEIIDRKSRRGRKFDDGEEVVNPFMRSMPY